MTIEQKERRVVMLAMIEDELGEDEERPQDTRERYADLKLHEQFDMEPDDDGMMTADEEHFHKSGGDIGGIAGR